MAPYLDRSEEFFLLRAKFGNAPIEEDEESKKKDKNEKVQCNKIHKFHFPNTLPPRNIGQDEPHPPSVWGCISVGKYIRMETAFFKVKNSKYSLLVSVFSEYTS